MNTVINLSLSADVTREVAQETKRLKFASKSDFFRHLFREWKRARVLDDVKKSEEEYKKGKSTKLDSIKELWT